MEKIFYADKTAYDTESAIKKVLSDFYGFSNAKILKTENGKPYVLNAPHFSVTHTDFRLYLVFDDTPIGIDAEPLSRQTDFQKISKKFPLSEQLEIIDQASFLQHWTVKESAVKYLGSTLAKELKQLSFVNGKLLKNELPFPAKITLLIHEEHLISVCSAKDFSNAAFIPF